jgi:hypothetical protein
MSTEAVDASVDDHTYVGAGVTGAPATSNAKGVSCTSQPQNSSTVAGATDTDDTPLDVGDPDCGGASPPPPHPANQTIDAIAAAAAARPGNCFFDT